MNKVITKIEREKGFTYKVDKEGNVIKEKYNWFKDPYTLVTITIIILGLLFYMQVKDMKTIEANFEHACYKYMEMRNLWILENPGETPTLNEVLSVKKDGMPTIG